MTELITIAQANRIMLILLIAAPVLGLALGALTKRIKLGVLTGIGIGGGNYVMWKVYSAITDRLGLDTVKNLLVNLGLFIAVGVIVGLAIGRMSKPNEGSDQ